MKFLLVLLGILLGAVAGAALIALPGFTACYAVAGFVSEGKGICLLVMIVGFLPIGALFGGIIGGIGFWHRASGRPF